MIAVMIIQPARPSLQALRGGTTIAPDSPASLRAWDDQIDGMLRTRELRVRQVREDTLIPGRTHERMTQFHEGVPVFGGEAVRQTDSGVTVSLFGTIYQGIDTPTVPTLSVDGAVAAIQGLTGVSLGPARLPELFVLPLTEGRYALAYRGQVATEGDVTVYFVDARTGAVLLKYSNLQTAAAVGRATGVLGDNKKISADSFAGTFVASDDLRPPVIDTFDMRGNLGRTLSFLNGSTTLTANDLASDADNVWTDGPNVDAHAYAGYVYDYYFKRLGRRGLDNANIPMSSLVHPVRRQDLSTSSNAVISLFFLNAFYAGDGVMVYGEGLPAPFVLASTRQSVNYFSAALDIVGHELTHGVTDYSSDLIYQGESGALNEAFSDIMGTSVEFFYQAPGGGLMSADYLLGEDVFVPGGVRSMANPAAFGGPDHYSRRYTGTDDNGGVHTNAGIPNHAFYLAIEGGTNRTSGLSVQGVGAANREQIEKVFYRAFVFLLPPNATFSVARSATIQAARDLYGGGSAVERTVTEAWTAVGVN
jgi:thermolysin